MNIKVWKRLLSVMICTTVIFCNCTGICHIPVLAEVPDGVSDTGAWQESEGETDAESEQLYEAPLDFLNYMTDEQAMEIFGKEKAVIADYLRAIWSDSNVEEKKEGLRPLTSMRQSIADEGSLSLTNGTEGGAWINGPFGYRTSQFAVTLNGVTSDAYCIDPTANTPPGGDYNYYVHENGAVGTATYAAASILYQYEYQIDTFRAMWTASMEEAAVPDSDRNRFDLNDPDSTYFMLHSLVSNCWHAGAVWDSGVETGAYQISGHQEFKNAFAIFYTKLLLADHPDGYQVYFVRTGDAYQNIIFANYKPKGTIVVNKQSQNIEIQNEHPESYSLEGAEYGIYASYENAEQDLDRLETLVISNGTAVSRQLEEGVYYVREVKEPLGYRLNPEIIEVMVIGGDSSLVSSTDTLYADTISLQKRSSDPELTDQNPLYSLAGAVYQIYKDPDCTMKADDLIVNSDHEIIGKEEAVLTTNEDGSTNILTLARGIYYVKEIQASPGYSLNPEVILIDIRSAYQSQPYMIETTEEPLMAQAKVRIRKQDSEGITMVCTDEHGEEQPGIGGASLEGAVFKVSYYKAYYQTKELLPDTSDAVWYISTGYDPADQNYEAVLDEDHLAAGYTSSSFYHDKNGQIAIPLGTVVVSEVQAPTGYQTIAQAGYMEDQGGIAEQNAVIMQIRGKDDDEDGNADHAHIYVRNGHSDANPYSPYVLLQEEAPIICHEGIDRGDVSFTKTDLKSGREMAHVFFRITSSSGESHIICTDDRGYYSSKAAAHSHNTNAWDSYYDPDGRYLGPEDPEELLRQLKLMGNCGTWFYGTPDPARRDPRLINDERGALRYDGSYMIEELPGPYNRGKQLISKTFCIDEEGVMKWIGNIANIDIPEIHTLEWDQYSGNHSSAASPDFESQIIDRVTYANLPEEHVYTVKGILMELQEDGSVTGPLLKEDGSTIQAYAVFETPKSSYTAIPYVNGTVDVEYHFYGDDYAGRRFVIYEYLFDGEDTEPLLIENGEVVTDEVYRVRGTLIMHADARDTDQIGSFLDIHTRARDSVTETDSCILSDSMTISDIVEYEDLVPGYEYKLYGELVYRDILTDQIERVKDSNGKPVTALIHFVPEEANGEIVLDFPEFSGSQLYDEQGECLCTGLVVYETLLWNNRILAVHKDIEDQDQTVTLLKQGRIRVQKMAEQIQSVQNEAVRLPNGESVVLTKLHREFLPYAGVTFTIYDADTDRMVGSFQTDPDGIGISDMLSFGDGREYYIMETDVDAQYCRSEERYPIHFAAYDPEEVCIDTTPIVVNNQARSVQFDLYKQEESIRQDRPGQYVIGKRNAVNTYYGIYNRNEILTADPATTIDKDSLLSVIKTDENGYAYGEESLPQGDYYCKELCTSGEEYILDSKEYDFTIDYTDDQEEMTEKNSTKKITINGGKPLLNRYKSQRVDLYKVDDSDEPIEGVAFDLYRLFDDEYDRIGSYITDQDGHIMLERLPYGDYYFIETKGAAGYEFDGSRKYEFAIKEDQKKVTSSMLDITQYGQAADEIMNCKDLDYVSGSIAMDSIVIKVVNKKLLTPTITDTPTYTKRPEISNQPETTEQPEVTEIQPSPKTGDAGAPFLWWIALIAAGGILAYYLIIRHNRRRR